MQQFHVIPTFLIPSAAAAIAIPVGQNSAGLNGHLCIHGTVSYVIVQRTREIGIHAALGAKRRDILGLMLRQCTRSVVVELVVGVFIRGGCISSAARSALWDYVR